MNHTIYGKCMSVKSMPMVLEKYIPLNSANPYSMENTMDFHIFSSRQHNRRPSYMPVQLRAEKGEFEFEIYTQQSRHQCCKTSCF